MYRAARHTLAQRAARRTLLLLTLAAAITATLLLSACTAQQLEPDPTAPIDPATLPADGRLAIARLDIATGATSATAPQADIAQGAQGAPATRLNTGTPTWETGDAIRVTATAKATGAPIVGYYSYQAGGTWLQEDMKENPNDDPAVMPADTYPLYIDDIDRTQPIRIDSWGGNICDQDLVNPDAHYYTDQGIAVDPEGSYYHLNDHLAAPTATLHTVSTPDAPGAPTRGSLTATLTHQQVDVVVRLITDAAHPLKMDADGKLDNDFTLLHLALADGNSTGTDGATIRSWIASMTDAAPDAPDAERGKSIVTFRAYVKPADLPAAGTDGITPLGTLTYATSVYNGDNGTGTITLPGSGKLPLKYKLSDPSPLEGGAQRAGDVPPVQAGTRLTITIDFTKLNGLALSATVSPWTIEEGGEVITQPGADGTQPLDPAVFNASNPVWIISGGGTPDTDALVAKNVKKALDALPAGTSNITLMMAGVKTVPENAFRNCTQLAALTLSGATSIGAQAFSDCKALARIDLPEAQTIEKKAFYSCLALPAIDLPAATSIGLMAFYRCEALATASLPRVQNLGGNAFQTCQALSAISLPVAQSIGAQAFDGCIRLTALSLPAAQSIGAKAFTSCTRLVTASLPAATSIDADIFADSKANIVTLDLSGLTAIGDGAFQGYTKLQSITLNGAKSVGKNAFDGCESLATALLPAATSIGQYAFIRTYLSTISLPAATSIGAQAFSGCTGLTTVSLPVAITVGDGAFAGCAALTSLSLTAPGSITVNAGSFGGFYSDACALTLNADKAKDAAGDAKPKVDGKTWGGVAWKEITHAASARR